MNEIYDFWPDITTNREHKLNQYFAICKISIEKNFNANNIIQINKAQLSFNYLLNWTHNNNKSSNAALSHHSQIWMIKKMLQMAVFQKILF